MQIMVSLLVLIMVGLVLKQSPTTHSTPTMPVTSPLTVPKRVFGLFRLVGFAEGISFLLLLCVAVPLKYYAHVPIMVRIVGPLHGMLFIVYLAALAYITFTRRWTASRIVGAFAASLVPFGTFVFDRMIKEKADTRR